MNKTNEQIINEINEKLSTLSQRERAEIKRADEKADREMIAKLTEKYHCTIETIDGDPHHIKVDGVVMGYVEFARWLEAKKMASAATAWNEDDEVADDYEDADDDSDSEEDDEDCNYYNDL